MEEAIGAKIADYLIKPVHPNQILLALKKNLDERRLVSEKTSLGYRKEFMQIGMTVSDKLNFNEWKDVYKKLVYWEIELDSAGEDSMNLTHARLALAAIAGREKIGVVAGTTTERVPTPTAIDHVITIGANNRIPTSPALDGGYIKQKGLTEIEHIGCAGATHPV